MPRARRLAFGLWLGWAAAAGAQEVPVPATGWQPLAFPKIERHTRYLTAREGDVAVITAESACSASGLLHDLRGVDLARTPLLRWRWRVDEGLPAADERAKAGDDFAARVYVTFAFEPERASVLERARRRLAGAIWGDSLPGSSLNYVWSSGAPVGERWPSPYAATSHMVVATSGAAAGWREVEADLLADYARAFSHPPPTPLFLALMTDTDDRCLRARAAYADFRFAPRPQQNASTPFHTPRSAREVHEAEEARNEVDGVALGAPGVRHRRAPSRSASPSASASRRTPSRIASSSRAP
jgi:hypothetical protein